MQCVFVALPICVRDFASLAFNAGFLANAAHKEERKQKTNFARRIESKTASAAQAGIPACISFALSHKKVAEAPRQLLSLLRLPAAACTPDLRIASARSSLMSCGATFREQKTRDANIVQDDGFFLSNKTCANFARSLICRNLLQFTTTTVGSNKWLRLSSN